MTQIEARIKAAFNGPTFEDIHKIFKEWQNSRERRHIPSKSTLTHGILKSELHVL